MTECLNDSIVNYRIPQRTHAFDADFHHIAGLHRADARRRAGGDQIAGKQRHNLGNEADYNIEGKDEIAGGALLAHLSVDACLHVHARPGVNFVADDGADGTEGVEALGASPLAILVLQVAGSDVVEAGVAEDIRPHVITLGEMAAAAADDDGELAFVVHALRERGGPANFACGMEQGRVGLEKDQRLGGNGVAQFLGVLDVIAAHAHNLRGFDGRDQGRIVERQLLHAAAGEFVEFALAQMRGGKQQARDVILAAHRLNQPVADLSFVREAAVFHKVSFKVSSFFKSCEKVAGSWFRYPTSYQLPANNYPQGWRPNCQALNIKSSKGTRLRRFLNTRSLGSGLSRKLDAPSLGMTGETKNAWDITCETAKLTQPPIKPNFDAVLDGVAEAAPFRNDFFKPILGTGYGF